MDISSAMDKIVTIQGGLSITSPYPVAVKKAWKYVPPQSVTLPELAAFVNQWTLVAEDRFVSLREQRYVVEMQLFARQIDLPNAAEVATAFMPKVMDAFDADVTLGGTVTECTLRGGTPTLVRLERGDLAYIGLDLFLDLVMKEAKAFS